MNLLKLRRAAAATVAVGLLAITAAPVAAAQPLTAVVTANDMGTPDSGKAWVRVLHGSPDAPAVDVKANDGDIITNLAFGQISDYLPVDAGTYNIKVCAAGTATCVFDDDLTFEDGKKYTVAASDMLASIDFNVFVDAPDEGEAEQTQVRVVHLSADTPAVDVLTQAGDSIGINDLAYPNATGYAKFDPASYDLKVCANADHNVCPLDPGPLDLAAGTAYSVFAIGSLQAALATDPPTDTVVAAPVAGSAPLLPIAVLSFLGMAAVGLLIGRRLSLRQVEDR